MTARLPLADIERSLAAEARYAVGQALAAANRNRTPVRLRDALAGAVVDLERGRGPSEALAALRRGRPGSASVEEVRALARYAEAALAAWSEARRLRRAEKAVARALVWQAG